MIEVRYKECRACEESKPLYEFKRIKQSSDGLSARCCDCLDKAKKPSEIQKIRNRFPEKKQFNPYPAHSARKRWS